MDFEYFGPARDLLYLSALLSGAALGSFLRAMDGKRSLKGRAAWISVLLCFVSLAISALSVSVIFSRGRIFSLPSLYPVLLFFFASGTLGLRFLRAGGCSIIFIAGILTVWVSVSFLSFPGFDRPERLSLRVEGGGLLIHRETLRPGAVSGETEESWSVEGPLVFEALALTAHPAWPLIGGTRRGMLDKVRGKDETVSLSRRDINRFRAMGGLGFSREAFTLKLPAGVLFPGMDMAVLFNGQRLYFDPPIQF